MMTTIVTDIPIKQNLMGSNAYRFPVSELLLEY